MDNTSRIYVQGLLDIDYSQVYKKIAELQKNVESRSVKIKLDIESNAQQQLQGIQRQLDSAYKMTNSGLIVPKNIDHTPIKQGTEAIRQQGEAIKNAAASTNTFSSNINHSGQYIQEATKHTHSWADSVKRIITYYISFHATINLVRQSLNTLKDMDSYLTELSKVTNIVRNDFKQLGLEALDSASKYGRSVQDMMGAQTIFAKAGFENYKQMAELSLVTQSAGDMSEAVASSYIIASDKAFQYGGSIEKLTALLDAQNQTSNKHAVSLEFLAEATQVSANAMKLAGETEQTATAAWTAMGVATQKTGNEVGRAARTIEMRIQGVKQAFEGLDFEINVDGEKEIVNAQELSDAAKALSEIGIEVIRIEDGAEKFATMTEIAAQLAAKLDEGTISATQMNKIVNALSGKHRSEYFLALINNMDEYNRAMVSFTNAQGSAMTEAAKQAESWEGRLNALKNSWVSFIGKTLDSSMFIGVIDSLNLIVTGFGNLGTVLGIVTAALITLKLPAMIAWFQTLTLQTKLLSMEVASAGGFFNLLKVAFTGTAASAGAAAAAVTALQIAVGAAVAIISIGIMAWNNHKNAMEENRRKAEEFAESQRQATNTLKGQIEAFDELNKRRLEIKGAEESKKINEELLDLQKKIRENIGAQAKDIDIVNGKYSEQADKLTEILLSRKK